MKYKNSDLIREVHEFGVDRQNREIFLFGRDEYMHGAASAETDIEEPGVDYAMANQFIRNFRILQNEGHAEPITIHLKTCGGLWPEGMAIYDMIRSHPGEVTAINYALARSMSSLIFLACDVRLMTNHSWFMFHEGTIGFAGTQRQFRTEAAQAAIENEQMVSIYFEHIRRGTRMRTDSDEAIVRWIKGQMLTKEEVYVDPADSIELGFATGMYGAD